MLFASCESTALTPASNLKLLAIGVAAENWNGLLVSLVERKLKRSRFKNHRWLLEPSGSESLGLDFPTRQHGLHYLVWTGFQSDNRLADWLLDGLRTTTDSTPHLVLSRYLAAQGIPAPDIRVLDGSGRSPHNRLAPVTLVMLLRHFWNSDAELRDRFVQALPVPGTNSTLARRGLGVGTRLRAKTGYIKSCFSLSGYLSVPTDTLAFSIIVNNCPSGRSAYRLFTRLLLALLRSPGTAADD